jgi:hypothetical protein
LIFVAALGSDPKSAVLFRSQSYDVCELQFSGPIASSSHIKLVASNGLDALVKAKKFAPTSTDSRSVIGFACDKWRMIMTSMKKLVAAALLSAMTATPVFAQAAIHEPGNFAFFYPNLDVLNGGAPTPAARLASDPAAMQAYQERQSGMAPAFTPAPRHRLPAFQPSRGRDGR